MNADDTALIVIDVQEKLLPHILDHTELSWNITRLIRAAKTLGLPIRATEQYPKGLGHTVEPIRKEIELQSGAAEKLMFSCRECESVFKSLSESGIHNLLLCGIETHVCVAQTALDMLASGFDVYLCLDAIGSRSSIDHDTAIRRMESSGATLTTTEAAMFEWCERAGSDKFKTISKLVQESASDA